MVVSKNNIWNRNRKRLKSTNITQRLIVKSLYCGSKQHLGPSSQYRQPSLFLDFLSANLLISIGKNWSKIDFLPANSVFAVKWHTVFTAENEGNLYIGCSGYLKNALQCANCKIWCGNRLILVLEVRQFFIGKNCMTNYHWFIKNQGNFFSTESVTKIICRL